MILPPSIYQKLERFHKLYYSQALVDLRINRWTVVVLVYTALVLDNILLTVVVPIVPDYLYSMEHPTPTHLAIQSPQPLTNVTKVGAVLGIFRNINESLFGEVTKEHLPNEHIPEDIIEENGKVGALFASKALVQLVINPCVGSITNYYGYSVPFIFGTITLFISSMIFSCGRSYLVLLLARMLHGVASSFISVAGMGTIAVLFTQDDQRSQVMGHVLGGIALGVMVGYPFGGLLYDQVGAATPFLLISLAIAGLLLAQALLFPFVVTYCTGERATTMVNLLSDKYIILVATAICISTSVMAMLEPCLPIWLMDNIHPKKWQLGTVFIPDSLGYMIGTNCFAVISLKVGRYKVALLSLLLVGLCCLGVTYAHQMLDLVLPHFGLGLGIGIIDSSLMPLLAMLVETRHVAEYGSVFAIAQTAVAIAYGIGPLIGGYVVKYIGFKALMRFLAFLNLVYCPVLLFLRPVDTSCPVGDRSKQQAQVLLPGSGGKCYQTETSPVQPGGQEFSYAYTRLYHSDTEEMLD